MLSYFIYLFIPPFVLSFVPASFFVFVCFCGGAHVVAQQGRRMFFFFLFSTRLFFRRFAGWGMIGHNKSCGDD